MNKKIILIISAIVLVLIVVGALIFLQKDEVNSNSSPLNQKETNEEESLEADKETKKQIDEKTVLIKKLGVQARSFVERYGTYSTDNKYGNLKMLLPQMSAKLAEEVSQRISLKEEKSGVVSLTTKVINLQLKEFNQDSKIIYTGQIQEQEVNEQGTELKQKDIEIIFIKENDQWKIDEVNYQ